MSDPAAATMKTLSSDSEMVFKEGRQPALLNFLLHCFLSASSIDTADGAAGIRKKGLHAYHRQAKEDVIAVTVQLIMLLPATCANLCKSKQPRQFTVSQIWIINIFVITLNFNDTNETPKKLMIKLILALHFSDHFEI